MISIHALHEESDVTSAATRSACSIFQSTLSMRRATQCARHCTQSFPISIHALHEESDLRRTDVEQHRKISIHALHEESDHASGMPGMAGQSISIHALHEESDRQYRRQRAPDQISIHALHEESDTTQAVPQSDCSAISIHALHEESDPILKPNTIRTDMSIQLSMRRATRAAHVRHGGTINFNPRSP